MKYMLLIYQGTTPTPQSEGWERLSEDERKEVADAYREVSSSPGVTPGEWMQPPASATTVRVKDDTTLATDGPFAETKEAVGGYLLLDADSVDEAIELAARIPAARMGGAVEVRPLVSR